MKTGNRRAFTLIELMIGIAMMLIVAGGIATAIRSGLDLYNKAEAKSLVTNGVRFTVDSYSRRISAMLANASEVEILDDNDSIPESPESCDHYIYLSGQTVMHKSSTEDSPLEGSDYIDSLNFSIPVSSKDVSANYILTMDVGGLNSRYPSAKLDVTVKSALYNKPAKSGETVSGSNYNGKVLHFVSPVSFEIELKNLKILKENENGTDLSNSTSVAKGTKLYASYDIGQSDPPGFDLEDCSDIYWYISASSSPDISAQAAEAGLPQPTSSNQEKYCWLLVDNTNTPITGKTLDTSGKFYVRTAGYGGNTTFSEWGNYGIIRFYVKSKMKKVNGTDIFTGPEKQSPFAAITKAERGGKLWKEWMKAIQDIFDGEQDVTGFFNTSAMDQSEIHLDTAGGETYLTIKRNASGTAGSVTVAVAGGALLADEKIEAMKTDSVNNDKKSYTTVTNYSLIIDADVIEGNGYGILLNGASAVETSSGFKDCGYLFQYDKAIDSFPMRLYYNGTQDDTLDFGMELEYPNDSEYQWNYSSLISGTGGSYSSYKGPFYGPGYLKNSKFAYTSDSQAENRGWQVFPWNERRRILITVLEYYLKNKGPAYPKYIIRMKLLKPYADVTEDDPWQTGKDYFLSEPAWYGDFVGDEYQHYQIYKNNTWQDASYETYINTSRWNRRIVRNFTVKNHSSYSGDTINPPNNSISDNNAKSRYIIKVPWGASDGYGTAYEGVFKAKEMDVRTDGGGDIFKTPSRNRYIGLRLWSDLASEVKFYSVNYAPGFTKQELQAIMPSGAKMYELGNGYNNDGTGEAAVSGVDQTHLNTGLFGSTGKDYSDGEGNGNSSGYRGVMGIQHLRNGCSCPICSKYAQYGY